MSCHASLSLIKFDGLLFKAVTDNYTVDYVFKELLLSRTTLILWESNSFPHYLSKSEKVEHCPLLFFIFFFSICYYMPSFASHLLPLQTHVISYYRPIHRIASALTHLSGNRKYINKSINQSDSVRTQRMVTLGLSGRRCWDRIWMRWFEWESGESDEYIPVVRWVRFSDVIV